MGMIEAEMFKYAGPPFFVYLLVTKRSFCHPGYILVYSVSHVRQKRWEPGEVLQKKLP